MQRHRSGVRRGWPSALGVLICLSLLPALASAEGPIDLKDIPPALKPWVRWVLFGEEAKTCPSIFGEEEETRCQWPSRLELRLEAKGGTFRADWHVHAPGWYPLPGDETRWPQEVTAGRLKPAVVARDEVPSIHLLPGDHTVSGRFQWDELPESLQVPRETGLLALFVKGKRVDRPNRQEDGMVFLQQEEGEASEGERLEIVVHRKIVDEVPLQLMTRIVLNIAGKKREVVLGRVLPERFSPLALESPLPARLEPDSRLRVQVRPGTFTIEVSARSQAPVSSLRRPAPGGPWREGEEVWVFEARSSLRLVTVEGVAAIDPAQTSLPDDWKRLPAYPMKLGAVLRLVEKRRGDADPAPERLTLSRTLWLDFDGRGFTTSDTIGGDLRRATRLEMLPPTRLGRVAVAGRDQFITHLDDPRQTGIELRPGSLSITADSRVETGPSKIPAVGWNRDFHRVSAELHLPPGWRLLHASGVDEVSGTWVRHWTLLEIFLVLVLSIAIGRLFGIAWGLVALSTFVLIFPESSAPKWIWAVVLALEALVRAFPAGRLRKVLGWARHAVAVLLILVGLPFLIGQVRAGMYPALELEAADEGPSLLGLLAGQRAAPVTATVALDEENVPAAPPPVQLQQQAAQAAGGEAADAVIAGKDAAEKSGEVARRIARAEPKVALARKLPAMDQSKAAWLGKKASLYSQYNVEVYDSNAMIQTGPGRPRWSWRRFDLRWSGPVQRGQQLHLFLSSPFVGLLLALLRAVLLALLILRALPWRVLPGRIGRGAVTTVLLGSLLFLPSSAAAQVPPAEVLEELGQRLSVKPTCIPSCASISRMLLEADAGTLRLRLELGAAAPTAVPLPGSAAQWLPDRVLLDGKPAAGLARDGEGTLWLLLSAGAHQAILEGTLPDRESVQISLPLKPHQVVARATGWTVEGLHEDGIADADLQLSRVRGRPASTGEKALEPGVLPPFVLVERTLLVGLNWQAETRVARLNAPGVAVVLEVPLLPGESVTTADLRVVGGKVLVNMGPQETEIRWTSVLKEKSPITLKAPAAVAWVESWRLDVHPLWHAETRGIPPVHPEDTGRPPEWRPWPGESVLIGLRRPAGVPGQTVTIDASTLTVEPGVRATDARLQLTIRASRGAEHGLTLPDGAVLEVVQVNGRQQPIRQVGRRITLPLVPGSQTVEVTWREPQGQRGLYRVRPVDLGAPSVNASTQIRLPDSRWLLLVGGPRLGPVVLFWSLLLVLLAVALALARIRWVPLRAWHWMLLAIGLSQIHLAGGALVVGWLVLFGWRARPESLKAHRCLFNLRQILIGLWTIAALCTLLVAIHEGLLGRPDMQLHGNDSSPSMLRWFQDRAAPTPEAAWALSVPLFVYRIAMLAWALWLAFAVLRWLRWGWRSFVEGGWWRAGPPWPPRPGRTAPPAPSTPAPGAGPPDSPEATATPAATAPPGEAPH